MKQKAQKKIIKKLKLDYHLNRETEKYLKDLGERAGIAKVPIDWKKVLPNPFKGE